MQVVLPLALLVGLLFTGSGRWAELFLTELAPGLLLPLPVLRLLVVLGVFVPVLLAMAASAAAVLPYDRRLRGAAQTTGAGVGQTMRTVAVVLVPVLLWQVVTALLPSGRSALLLPMALVFPLTMTALGPLLVNALMTTRPLEPALRARLLARCAEQGLRVRDVRLLDSRGGGVGNAAISGVLPQLRYVFLTDHLLELLDDDELDAVLAHEIGHGRGHHLLLKLVATLVAAGSAGALLVLGARALPSSGPAALVPLLGVGLVLPLVVLLVQGVLGVALEQRADDSAVRTVGAGPLVTALEKLADANGTKRRTGWLWNVLQQHPGLEQRLHRLTAGEARPVSAG